MSKKTFIQELCRENSTFSSPRQAEMVANLLDTVSSDIYSESQRFVFELIQNADDAAKDTNNEIHFDFLPNCLIVSHNGKPFDEKDIISLTGAGASTKRADPTKTGYKGIGFKSVFGKSERVTIFSDGYQFRFDKSFHKQKLPWQIIPIWSELNELSDSIQKSILDNNYAVSTTIEIKKPEELLEELNELLSNGQILLFLRRVSKISVSYNGKPVSSIEKKIISQDIAFNETTLYKDGKEISSWLTKSFEQISIPEDTKEELRQDEKTPEKLKEAEYTELSFAAKIEEGKLKSLKSEESLIFTYLPTKVSDFEFPFLINGSFLTNAAREGLHEDRVWNQWLFKLTAEKIIEWLEILSKSKFKFQILQLLPSKFGGIHNELRVSFNQSLEKSVKEKAFIPSKNAKLKKISDIVIDKIGLSELSFLSPETVIGFINQKENTNFKTDSLINSQLQRADKLRSFGAMFFETENLEDFFLSDIFKKNHQPSENFSLIEYFHSKAAKDESKEWNEKLKSIPFIYAKGKKLKSPQAVCFPSIDFKTEFGDGVAVIHSEVYPKIETHSKIKGWLELLGVKEPSDEAYLENEIIGNIDNCIDINNYLYITRYIFNRHKKGLLSELHYDQLQDLKLYSTKGEFKAAKECYLSDFYEPSLRLEKVNDEGIFVSSTYKQNEDLISEWKTFFLYLGVCENVELRELRLSNSEAIGMYKDFAQFFATNSTQKYNAASGTIWHNTITTYKLTTYTLVEFAFNYEFSKLFWLKALEIPFMRVNNDKGFASWQNKLDLDENFFDWMISNSPIFPATTKVCLKANEIFINNKEIIEIAGNYLPVFDCDVALTKEWRKILPFKKNLELTDYLEILGKIANQKKKNENDETSKISGKKKIALIYTKLASSLSNFSKEEKQEISDWAKTNKIISQNETFANASELFWLKGTTSNFGGELELVFLPDELKDEENIEELLSLFGVTVISEFKLIKNKTVTNDSLQNELFSISPYLSAIVEKKSGEEFDSIFKKLKTLIKSLKVVNTASLELAYIYNGKQHVISKPDSYFDENENTLYFTGNWKSPTTMYSLIEHVAKALQIEKYQEELRLFLQLDPEDISEWLQSKFDINKQEVENMPAVSNFIEKLVSATEEEIKPSDAGVLMDNSSIKTRISINEEAQEIIFETLERNKFIVENRNKITYTILEGVKNPNGKLIKVVVKSVKAGRIYFTPLEWLALTEEDSQLFVLTAGNKVRNVTLADLQRINDEFHMRFNTEQFVISNLKILANFFKGLPYTHFIFMTPESTTDYLQQFGLSERNSSSKELSADDKNLLL
ncbi:ATP-binding protein [Candidatus Pollutiaquabacter sp.]|uniref:ATP-binding protein n=1 Tax=Candidatus Pollutiaquabacter sp. TaxID=3416354 RepID=UPI003CBF9B35|nr:hypothetical protein [Bacteroidota bacterium]